MKKDDLLRDKQPFGVVYETPMMGAGMNGPMGAKNMPGKTTEWMSEGVNQPQSNANKAPQAHAMACKGVDNPFNWVGKSFPSVATFVPLNANPF